MNKIPYKKKILKGTIVLLITAVMILPTAVTANTEEAESDFETLDDIDILLEEGFEEGIMPPTDWDVISQSSKTWGIIDAASYPEYVHSGSYAAYVFGYFGQDEWLISPEIDLSGYEPGTYNVMLDFWANSQTSITSFTVEVHVMGDGFDDIIWDMIADEDWANSIYREVTLDLSSYCGEIINVAWRYVSDTGLHFFLDDIQISGWVPPPKTMLEIGQIGGSGMIFAVIKNTGNVTANDVEWSITVQGGVLDRINEVSTGVIDKLKKKGHRDDEETVPGPSVFGLGKVTITVTVESEDADPQEISRDAVGFVFLSKYLPIFIVEED